MMCGAPVGSGRAGGGGGREGGDGELLVRTRCDHARSDQSTGPHKSFYCSTALTRTLPIVAHRRERERERERERPRDTERDRERQRQREGENGRDRDVERDSEREREHETLMHFHDSCCEYD